MNHDTTYTMIFGVIGCGIAAIASILIFAAHPTAYTAALLVVSMVVLIGFAVNALSAVR